MKELKYWSKNTFDHVVNQLESLRGDLENLERADPVGN